MKENEAFCYNCKKVKAIVLGADPGNFSDHGIPVEIKVAFGIGSGDSRYFTQINKNLNIIGLSLTDVYIQNLITSDPGEETTKNVLWEELADNYVIDRAAEFNRLDPKHNIPVLVTAEKILKYLSYQRLPNAETLYLEEQYHPILAKQNKLGRPIYPFFRHLNYSLGNEKWKDYQKFLKGIFI